MYTHVSMKIMREAARAKIFQKIKKLLKYLKVKIIQNTFIYQKYGRYSLTFKRLGKRKTGQNKSSECE